PYPTGCRAAAVGQAGGSWTTDRMGTLRHGAVDYRVPLQVVPAFSHEGAPRGHGLGRRGGGRIALLLGEVGVTVRSRNAIAGTRSGRGSMPAASSSFSMRSTRCSVHDSSCCLR